MNQKPCRDFKTQNLGPIGLRKTLGGVLVVVWLGGLVGERGLAPGAVLAGQVLFGQQAPADNQQEPPLVIHITDLYRPPADPDDHFDLACAFALAKQGYIELVAVVIEAPKADFAGDPDVMAVAQLNRLTGLAVPVVAGMPAGEGRPEKPPKTRTPLSRWMEQAVRPVVLVSTGSCRDVALAFQEDPKLFVHQVDAVYVNAGLSSPEPAYQAPLEYNVALDPKAYQAMFGLPTGVYWLPCFEGTNTGLMWRVSRHASLYRFRQEEVFSQLAPPVQNYFLWMLDSAGRPAGAEKESWFWQHPTRWLRALDRPVDPELLARHGRTWRSMWSTAGQLHAAGLTVTREGRIVPVKEAGDSAVFDFVPVQVECNEQGITHWRPIGPDSPPQQSQQPRQYILQIRDLRAYPTAMSRALSSLLQALSPKGQD